MTARAYYNEIDPYAAQWLRNLISAGHIAPGDVDERSIMDVQPDDLKGYDQCHFFAGIGGWSVAARLAGWSDDRPLWTGSCPCQPFSVAGRGGAQKDERHLWPTFFELIRACRPDVVMGEQVAAAVGKNWLDGVHSDLEGIGYSFGAAVVPACAVDAPHRRDRLWFVADASQERRDRLDALLREEVSGRDAADFSEAAGGGESNVADAGSTRIRGGRPFEDVGQAGAGKGKGRNGNGFGLTIGMLTTAGTGAQPSSSSEPTEKQGALNPEFVCWLMGFPPEWESCAPTAMPSSRKSRPK